VILGTRGSLLARAQTGWVKKRLEAAVAGIDVSIRVIRTTGDTMQTMPEAPAISSGPAAKGIFVKEIEEALEAGEIDAAVHSLKDVPVQCRDDLPIVSVPSRGDPRDALLTLGGSGRLDSIPRGGRVGTGSPRRGAQLLLARPDLQIAMIRGNIDTRVRGLLAGDYEAIVLAAAGLDRAAAGSEGFAGLLQGVVMMPLPDEVCLPAPGQGALAIQTRAGDSRARGIVSAIQDDAAASEVTAERAFLEGLGGGCRVPVAALGRVSGEGALNLRGLVCDPEGRRVVRVQGDASPAQARELGLTLAREALARGAAGLLAAS